jgi:hypothetical protein
MTSGDNGEAPEAMSLTRPSSLAFILLNTNLSHIGGGFRHNNTNQTSNIMLKMLRDELNQTMAQNCTFCIFSLG